MSAHPALAYTSGTSIDVDSSGYSLGSVRMYSTDPMTTLMSDGANPMLMVRELGLGKIAYFNTAAASYANTSPTEDNDWRDVLLGTVEWMDLCVDIFEDLDGDGFGNSSNSVEDCNGVGLTGFVDNADDCDDLNASMSPNMI